MRQTQRLCKKQAKHVKELKSQTDAKLSVLLKRKQAEFTNLSLLFTSLRQVLEAREAELQALFNEEVGDLESRLVADSELVTECHQAYVSSFNDLKKLGEEQGKNQLS